VVIGIDPEHINGLFGHWTPQFIGDGNAFGRSVLIGWAYAWPLNWPRIMPEFSRRASLR
jgi:hypothetical protein